MSWWQLVRVFAGHGGWAGAARFCRRPDGLLNQLGIQKISLVGQSMGGNTVTGFASKHPERVGALIMSDTAGAYPDPEIAALREDTCPRPSSIARAFAPDFAQREPAKYFPDREINALTLPRIPRPLRRAPHRARISSRSSGRRFQCCSSWARKINSCSLHDGNDNNGRVIELLGVKRPRGDGLHQSFNHTLGIQLIWDIGHS